MTLHIFKTETQLKNNLSLIAPGLTRNDDVLLIESAVYAARNPIKVIANVHALSEDIQARGIGDDTHADIKAVNYAGFVALSENHKKIISW